MEQKRKTSFSTGQYKKRTVVGKTIILAGEVFLLLSVTALMLFASEIFLRWHYRGVLSSAHGITYFHNHSLKKFIHERNALGLRGKHFEVGKRNAFRIVVLGDSLAYGQGVYPYEKRFPEQAEKLFKEQHPDLDVEFINTGIAGQDLRQHNKYLASFVLKLKPDFVLYQWYINDMNTTYHLSEVTTPPLISNRKLHASLMENSVLYFLLQQSWSQIRVKMGTQKKYSDYLVEKFIDSTSVPSIAAKEQLNKLLDRLKKENIAYGIVLFPSFATPMREYTLGFLHERVLNTCTKRNIVCLDLRDTYMEYDSHIKALWANVFDPHPSELAHRLAAEKIVAAYGDQWAKMATK